MLTRDELRARFSYDPETGVWTRMLATRGGRDAVGTVAGSVNNSDGYRYLKLMGARFSAHRLAFLFMTGSFPSQEIDHINGDRIDNRWANLREASHAQNMINKKRHANNKSGLKGVSLHKGTRRWHAQIQLGGIKTHLGLYDCPAAAHFAYVVASAQAFGAFSRAA